MYRHDARLTAIQSFSGVGIGPEDCDLMESRACICTGIPACSERINGGVGTVCAVEPAMLRCGRDGADSYFRLSVREAPSHFQISRANMPITEWYDRAEIPGSTTEIDRTENRGENCACGEPTAAKNCAMPNSRKARLVLTGMCHTGTDMAHPTEYKPDNQRTSGHAETHGLGNRGTQLETFSRMPRTIP